MPGKSLKMKDKKCYLDKFLAPKLGLKKCLIMPLKNLNDTLVNGLIGIVIDMFEDSVNVKF